MSGPRNGSGKQRPNPDDDRWAGLLGDGERWDSGELLRALLGKLTSEALAGCPPLLDLVCPLTEGITATTQATVVREVIKEIISDEGDRNARALSVLSEVSAEKPRSHTARLIAIARIYDVTTPLSAREHLRREALPWLLKELRDRSPCSWQKPSSASGGSGGLRSGAPGTDSDESGAGRDGPSTGLSLALNEAARAWADRGHERWADGPTESARRHAQRQLTTIETQLTELANGTFRTPRGASEVMDELYNWPWKDIRAACRRADASWWRSQRGTEVMELTYLRVREGTKVRRVVILDGDEADQDSIMTVATFQAALGVKVLRRADVPPECGLTNLTIFDEQFALAGDGRDYIHTADEHLVNEYLQTHARLEGRGATPVPRPSAVDIDGTTFEVELLKDDAVRRRAYGRLMGVE